MKHLTNVHDCMAELNNVQDLLDCVRSHLELVSDRQRQFAADASHELRTPIAGLRAQLEEGLLHPGETPLPELLGHALKDVDRLQQIIADLLLLVQLESGVTSGEELLDLAELVKAQISSQENGIEVSLRLNSQVIVKSVRRLIARVVINLLDNARRHATHVIEVQVLRNKDCAELTVTDDGPGIAVPDREHVFGVFSRLDAARDRDQGGAGLGLALARSIVAAHDGTLMVEDAPRPGARLVMRLPLATPGIGEA